MIDLTGPLTRARITLLLGGRPFDLARVKGAGVVLSITHEHKDSRVEVPLKAELLDPANGERLRVMLETMVRALDRDVFPDRETFVRQASQYITEHRRAVANEWRL